MLELVPSRVYAGNSAWYIELKYNEVESKNKFEFLLYCSIVNSHFCYCTTVEIQCCSYEKKWE